MSRNTSLHLTGQRDAIRAKVREFCEAHPLATVAELAAVLGVKKRQANEWRIRVMGRTGGKSLARSQAKAEMRERVRRYLAGQRDPWALTTSALGTLCRCSPYTAGRHRLALLGKRPRGAPKKQDRKPRNPMEINARALAEESAFREEQRRLKREEAARREARKREAA